MFFLWSIDWRIPLILSYQYLALYHKLYNVFLRSQNWFLAALRSLRVGLTVVTSSGGRSLLQKEFLDFPLIEGTAFLDSHTDKESEEVRAEHGGITLWL